ncbi:MAG: hypothetical protein AABX52_00090, partial [Nanoarchaeota archaeon]
MSESIFLKTVKQIVAKYPDMFDALEEYDRTRRLRKLSYKQRANFTIDADLLRRFRAYCQQHGYNMSRLIEKNVREEM